MIASKEKADRVKARKLSNNNEKKYCLKGALPQFSKYFQRKILEELFVKIKTSDLFCLGVNTKV
ncbi:hypothetical protein L1D32_00235 [Shewanella insulae]|uniref:hypothetical protein n=1 Tax=Shewanella insulae TaxID=2681496 RepID=UPI001EFC8274|nr:hypothetical protein [Shewanella insulae]MCG9736598.1 hypothetical protein [Shewanella insulae]